MGERRWVRAAAAFTGVATLCGCAASTDIAKSGGRAPRVLHLATVETSHDVSAAEIQTFAKQVDLLSKGRLQIKVSYQTASDAPHSWDGHLAQQVETGQLDLADVYARTWDTVGVTTFRALNAPFLLTNDALVADVISGPLADTMMAGLAPVGLVGLTLLPDGLRHPEGFGAPLLWKADYAAATIWSPRSYSAWAYFQALGANMTDTRADPVRGADNTYGLSTNFGPGVYTGNVTFWPKINTLVVNAKVLRGLSAADQTVLRRAAVAARTATIAALPSDVAAAASYCRRGGGIVVASPGDLAALQAAAGPLNAALANDPTTNRLMAAFAAAKARHPDGPTVTPCAEPPGATAPGGVASPNSAIVGVYRVQLDYKAMLAAGVPPVEAAGYAGIQQFTFESNGTFIFSGTAPDGSPYPDCPGTYIVTGKRVTINDGSPTQCLGVVSSDFAVSGSELHFTNADAQTSAQPLSNFFDVMHKVA